MKAREFVSKWSKSPWVRMAHITRYSSLPILNKESVAEHSWFVCLLSLAIARYLIEDSAIKVDVRLLLERAVTHDLDESLSGDFIRPFKYADPELKKQLDRVIHVGMYDALEGFPGRHEFYAAWAYSKADDLEGRILAVADLWSVVIYARRELLMGNAYARRVLKEVSSHLIKLAKEFAGPNPTDINSGKLSLPKIVAQLAVFAQSAARDEQANRLEAYTDLTDPYERSNA